MKIKNRLEFSKSIAVFIGVGLICFISCFIFSGCEDSLEMDTETFNTDRFISITDLNNPETLMQTENVKDYLEAYSRFSKHVVIKKQKLIWNINSGSEINISKDLFQYISNYLNNINREIDKGKLSVFLEEGEIRIFKKTNSGLLRLKSANESDGCNPVNFGASSQEIGEAIINAFNCFSSGSYSTEELFDLSSGNFSIINMQASGTFSMGGYTYYWGFTDITAGGANNIYNEICSNDREQYGSMTVDMLRYCSGNSAVQITSYSSAAAAYLQTLIP